MLFKNDLDVLVQVHYADKEWGVVPPRDTVSMQTFHTHKFTASVKSTGQVLGHFTVDSHRGNSQVFVVNSQGGHITDMNGKRHKEL